VNNTESGLRLTKVTVWGTGIEELDVISGLQLLRNCEKYSRVCCHQAPYSNRLLVAPWVLVFFVPNKAVDTVSTETNKYPPRTTPVN